MLIIDLLKTLLLTALLVLFVLLCVNYGMDDYIRLELINW